MQEDGNLVIYPNGWVPSDGIDLLEATHTSTASGYSGTAVASLEESGVRVRVGVRVRGRPSTG